jgi:hypothetical protein
MSPKLCLGDITRKNCFRYLKLMSPLKNKGQGPTSLQYATHRLLVMHPHTKYHWPISKDKKSYGPEKLRWEEVEEEEEKIRLKQCFPSFEGET